MVAGFREPVNSVMVLHDHPEDFRHQLEKQHQDVQFHFVSELEQTMQALLALRPEAVFSIRQTGFSGPRHRDAALFPSVRWFHSGGSGYEHLLPLARADLCLTNGRGVLAPFVAETVIGGMLALNGQFLGYFHQQRRKLWRSRPFRSISGQTILVVGLGAIGVEVARRAKGLGMHVLATSRTNRSDQMVDELHPPEALFDLLGRADVVTVHLPSTDETRHLIDATALATMKRGAILINTARGDIVDENAVLSALNTGHLAGAYIDVFGQEPLPRDNPLWDHENLIVSPHNADCIVGWPGYLAQFFSGNLQRWNTGQPLLNEIPRGKPR